MISQYNYPNIIKDFIQNFELEEMKIGCSDSQIFCIKKNDNNYFLKIMKKDMLVQEYNRLQWLQDKFPVPKIVMFHQENGFDFLITEEIAGEMLCNDYYVNDPEKALFVLKEAFQKISNVEISNCPFHVSNDYKLSCIRKNVKNGFVTNESLKEETLKKFGSVENVIKYLESNRFEEEKMFSHGDPSLPNIFGNKDSFVGMIDVGECGIADNWFDLAICEKSISRNFGREYVDKFYNMLNIKRDSIKVEYYLLMMELYL